MQPEGQIQVLATALQISLSQHCKSPFQAQAMLYISHREQEKIPLGSKLRDLEDFYVLVRALCVSVSSSTLMHVCFPDHNAIQSLHLG